MKLEVDRSSEDFLKVKTAVQESEAAYLKLLEDLVNIDTDTGNMDGSIKITTLLKKELESIGAQVELFHSEKGVHLVARLQGSGKKVAFLYDHTDTVIPNKEDFHFRYDKTTQIAYGPGTSDSKGSVAFLVQNLKIMHNLKLTPYKELILYLDAEEETGSDLSKQLVESLAKQADYAFVADGGRPDLGIVTKRKTVGHYTITIQGTAGHAGNGAQSSSNAMTEAGHIIVALENIASPLPKNPSEYTLQALKEKGIKDYGQFVPENTINVGVLKQPDGAKTNIICGQVVLELDVRCFEQSEHERIVQEIYALAKHPQRQGIHITVTGQQEYEAVEAKGEQKGLADLYSLLGKELLDKEITHWQAGGVTPGNVMALHTPILDSVGVDANPALEHSIYEELYVDSYVPRSILMIEFIKAADNL